MTAREAIELITSYMEYDAMSTMNEDERLYAIETVLHEYYGSKGEGKK